jgi:cell division protein FtsB
VLPWWGWVLVWIGVLLGSAAFLGWRVRQLWGRTTALTREVQRASRLVAELEARADELRDVDPALVAVTQPTHRMRAEYREHRATTKAARRARRTDRLPPWARVH